jgi:hypothetical protein
MKYSFLISDESMNYMNGSLLCAKILNKIQIEKNIDKTPFYIVSAFENYEVNMKKVICADDIFTKPLH